MSKKLEWRIVNAQIRMYHTNAEVKAKQDEFSEYCKKHPLNVQVETTKRLLEKELNGEMDIPNWDKPILNPLVTKNIKEGVVLVELSDVEANSRFKLFQKDPLRSRTEKLQKALEIEQEHWPWYTAKELMTAEAQKLLKDKDATKDLRNNLYAAVRYQLVQKYGKNNIIVIKVVGQEHLSWCWSMYQYCNPASTIVIVDKEGNGSLRNVIPVCKELAQSYEHESPFARRLARSIQLERDVNFNIIKNSLKDKAYAKYEAEMVKVEQALADAKAKGDEFAMFCYQTKKRMLRDQLLCEQKWIADLNYGIFDRMYKQRERNFDTSYSYLQLPLIETNTDVEYFIGAHNSRNGRPWKLDVRRYENLSPDKALKPSDHAMDMGFEDDNIVVSSSLESVLKHFKTNITHQEIEQDILLYKAWEDFIAKHPEAADLRYDIDTEHCPRCGEPFRFQREADTEHCPHCDFEWLNPLRFADENPDWHGDPDEDEAEQYNPDVDIDDDGVVNVNIAPSCAAPDIADGGTNVEAEAIAKADRKRIRYTKVKTKIRSLVEDPELDRWLDLRYGK